MIFVDTNYFLRFLLEDVESQSLQAKKLIVEAATGKVKLFTSLVAFFEVYWVLRSYYEKNRRQIFKALIELLDLEFIKLEERVVLESSLRLFKKSNLSLEDCYNLSFAKAKKAQDFKTFDKKLAKYFSE